MNKTELHAVQKRKWDEIIYNAHCVYVVPSRRKHDSGYLCMDFVAVTFNNERIGFGGGCDDISFEGKHFRIDCHPENGCVRIWNNYPFSISDDVSSITFTEEQSK